MLESRSNYFEIELDFEKNRARIALDLASDKRYHGAIPKQIELDFRCNHGAISEVIRLIITGRLLSPSRGDFWLELTQYHGAIPVAIMGRLPNYHGAICQQIELD